MVHIVHLKGGFIGDNPKLDSKGRNVYKEFQNKDEAKAYAKRMNSRLSPGEKKHYKMRFVVEGGDEK